MEIAISSILGLLIGAVVVFFFKKIQDESTKKSAKNEAEKIISSSKS